MSIPPILLSFMQQEAAAEIIPKEKISPLYIFTPLVASNSPSLTPFTHKACIPIYSMQALSLPENLLCLSTF